MEYGQETRSAVQDANNNIVDVPSVRQTVRAQGVTGRKEAPTDTSNYELAGQLTSNLATRMRDRVVRENEEERARQELQGAQDQGEAEAINDIALLNKRTGFAEFLFGQNATYEGAQRRAVENSISEWANEEAYGMEKNAGLSREEYAAKLEAAYQEKAQHYENDPETLSMLQAQYQDVSRKLMKQYTKERYAYTQTQNYQTMAEKVGHATDSLVMDTNGAATPEDLQEVVGGWTSFYNYEEQMAKFPNDQTITEANFDKIHVNNITSQLRKGNVQAYLAAEKTGFLAKLPRTTQDAIETAHDNWRRQSDMNAYKTLDELNKQSEMVTSLEDIEDLEEAYIRNSASHPEIYTAAKLPAFMSKARRHLAAFQNDKNRSIKAADELFNLQQAGYEQKYKGAHTFKLTPKQQTNVDKYTLVSRMSGDPLNVESMDLSQHDIVEMLRDPANALRAAQGLGSIDRLTGIEKAAIDTSMQQLFSGRLVDEEGFMAQEGHQLMGNLDIYERENPGLLAKTLNKEEYLRYRVLKWGVQNQRPMADIQSSWAKDRSGAATEDYKVQGSKKGRYTNATKDEYLREQFNLVTGIDHQSPDSFLEYKDAYDMMLRMTGDQKTATHAANSVMKGNNVTAIGKNVIGGMKLQNWLLDAHKNSPEISIDEFDFDITKLTRDDPNVKDGKIPSTPATLDELLKFMQNDTQAFNMYWDSMNLNRNPNTGKFDDEVLRQSRMEIQVHPSGEFVEFTTYDKQGFTYPTRMSFEAFKWAQREYSKQVYRDNRTAELNELHKIKVRDIEMQGHGNNYPIRLGSTK